MIVLSPVSANRPASNTGSWRRVARRFAAPLYSLEKSPQLAPSAGPGKRRASDRPPALNTASRCRLEMAYSGLLEALSPCRPQHGIRNRYDMTKSLSENIRRDYKVFAA